MKALFDKPHIFFFGLIPIILLYGIVNTDSNLAINIHDTYFVIAHFHLAVFIAMISAGIGLGYWVVCKSGFNLSYPLNQLHILTTFFIPLLIWIVLRLYQDTGPDQDFESRMATYDFNDNLHLIISILLLLLLVVQIVYPINLFQAFSKSRK